jgi:hypothetical protein
MTSTSWDCRNDWSLKTLTWSILSFGPSKWVWGGETKSQKGGDTFYDFFSALSHMSDSKVQRSGAQVWKRIYSCQCCLKCFLYFPKREIKHDPLKTQGAPNVGFPVRMSPQCLIPFTTAINEHPLKCNNSKMAITQAWSNHSNPREMALQHHYLSILHCKY